jgi:6-pyruvoyltetrahydropterin/6-carboxytetrahydropterin synthase
MNMTTTIKRFVETDTGHRVPNHKSKCKHMHGHRYRWEAVIEGDIIQTSGVSDEGMLIDFSDISEILEKHIHDVVDHSFIVYEKDHLAIQALDVLGDGHRTLIVPFIPTAENLAKWAFDQVEPHIESKYGQKIKLLAMNVRETPKSWASWKKD